MRIKSTCHAINLLKFGFQDETDEPVITSQIVVNRIFETGNRSGFRMNEPNQGKVLRFQLRIGVSHETFGVSKSCNGHFQHIES